MGVRRGLLGVCYLAGGFFFISPRLHYLTVGDAFTSRELYRLSKGFVEDTEGFVGRVVGALPTRRGTSLGMPSRRESFVDLPRGPSFGLHRLSVGFAASTWYYVGHVMSFPSRRSVHQGGRGVLHLAEGFTISLWESVADAKGFAISLRDPVGSAEGFTVSPSVHRKRQRILHLAKDSIGDAKDFAI